MTNNLRRIITRGVLDMATLQWDRSQEESFVYEGPMALADAPSLETITKSIGDIAAAATAAGVKVDKSIADLTTLTTAQNQRIFELEQKVATGARGGTVTKSLGRFALGQAIAADPRIEQLRKGEIQQARIVQKADLATIIKSVLVETGTSGASPEFGFPIEPTYIAPVPIASPGRKLQVLQALPHLTVGGGSAILPTISSTSDGSAVQEYQGGSKGESTLAVHPETLPMATVATFLNSSRQLLDDVATLPAFLQTWLTFFVLRKFENLILSGSGSASDGHITGLVNAGTAFTSAETYNADKIADAAFTALPSYGYAADLVILNSTDYLNLISLRATTNQYQAGAGWTGPNPNTIWGIRAVATPGLASGHAIVLDSQLVNILDRQEIAFLIGFQGSQFVENLFTYLAEVRGQLAVGDAHAVQVVALA